MILTPESKRRSLWILCLAGLAGACGPSRPDPSAARAPERASILLVTLDTTRADSIGPEAGGVETPSFNALAARGRRFTRAYATVPETLPSHSSMMTGLYPAGHGVHENARTLASGHPVLAERLRTVGYRTAAFVSSFVLDRRFGLSRGFETYDNAAGVERPASMTTDRAIEYLQKATGQRQLLWVHYFDAHAPYEPKEPFKTRYKAHPYLGEIAAVDEQLGRLIPAFERSAAGPVAIIVVGDHGEGLGDHGESQHGILLYESTMHVPLVVAGPGVRPGSSDAPVSTRRIFHTVLDLAGLDSALSLRGVEAGEVVLGEAMKPFLEFGWRPQVMAVDGAQKVISAGATEVYNLAEDPQEKTDLGESASLSRPLRNALKDYPVPALGAARSPNPLTDEDRRKLASLGYVSAGAAPVIRKDAPRPADMAHLFDAIERASTLFVNEQYAKVVPLLEKILREDPHNLDAALRLATAHSALGHDALAEGMFAKARDIAPESPDVRTYFALHLARGERFEEAAPILERILAESPDRLPALEALARIRERERRPQDAIELLLRVYGLRAPNPDELVRLGQLAMDVENTPLAIQSFEGARSLRGESFRHDLELGVLYLSARRFEEARAALDRVPRNHPDYPMALFKRAQVSVLLHEPDQRSRIELARQRANPALRALIDRERLFQEPRPQ